MAIPRGTPATMALRTLALAVLLACSAAQAQQPRAAQPADAVIEEPMHVHTAVQGDTLIGLAQRYLADPTRWPELARINSVRNPRRIPIGTELHIPLRLMRSTAVSATLNSVIGQVQAGAPASAVQAGQPLPEGTPISTGADGHVTIRLVDGTLLRLRPDSRLQLRESRELRDAAVVRSGARLDKGRVEIEAAPARPGRAGFTITTPQGVLGVRGTEFRVAIDEQRAVTRGEVLGGVVAFDADSAATATTARSPRVEAGYGAVIGGGTVQPPTRLLPAPQTTTLPALQERLLMRFALAPIDGAATYRGQVSRDTTFDLVVADLTSPTPELRFADLPDGNYVLRVRAIDAQGLEGRDADHRFRLKARPEAPLPAAPAPKAVTVGTRAELSWAANPESDHYRLQLASAADFKAPLLRDIADLRELSTTIEPLPPGTYHWRLASVRADGDQGPWGDARSFELRPPPPTPKPPKVSDQGVSFSWEGNPGQRFDFQVASDAAFATPLLQRQLASTCRSAVPAHSPAPAASTCGCAPSTPTASSAPGHRRSSSTCPTACATAAAAACASAIRR